uniref:Putative ovule protein n=1 Tax=Solanum chacoense TaxID=4108 RepID=A0A0V0GZJ6_SOLCH
MVYLVTSLLIYVSVSRYSKGFIFLLISYKVICHKACQDVTNFSYCLYRIMNLMDRYIVKLGC